jgi:hypothetical protein
MINVEFTREEAQAIEENFGGLATDREALVSGMNKLSAALDATDKRTDAELGYVPA